jgi:hypothetical protein
LLDEIALDTGPTKLYQKVKPRIREWGSRRKKIITSQIQIRNERTRTVFIIMVLVQSIFEVMWGLKALYSKH